MTPNLQPADAGCTSTSRANPRWGERLIAHLEYSCDIVRAAQRAGISPRRAQRARRTEPEFARAWAFAAAKGCEDLELDLLRRFRECDQLASNGTNYDFANAIRLLSHHREQSLRRHGEQRQVRAAEIRSSIDRKIADIRHSLANAQAEKGSAR